VHGNFPALQRALAALEAAGMQRLAALGDYLGRGDPDACVALIRERASLAVYGNRDLDWADRVGPETRAWVTSLPTVASEGELLIAHGDARLTPALSTAQIARQFQRAWPVLGQHNARVLAFGHSHHARVWRKDSASADAELLPTGPVAMDRAARYVLNVGTTGLPFPGKGGPSVALVDFSADLIRILPLDG
jgi:predicted phosphodiesterase